MPFEPEDLQPYLRLVPPGGLLNREYFSRDALAESIPAEEDKTAYMAAADAWVFEHGGRRFFHDDLTYYMLPQGEVPK